MFTSIKTIEIDSEKNAKSFLKQFEEVSDVNSLFYKYSLLHIKIELPSFNENIHLSTKQLEDWVRRDVEDWDSFYNYIEELSNMSRKLQTMTNQISALGYSDSMFVGSNVITAATKMTYAANCMSLQDVPIDKKSREYSCTLFDNGSQMTFASN